MNGLQHHEEVTAAVGKVAALVAYWTNYERRSLMVQDEALKNEIAELKESLVDLYATILEIQLCLTRYCDGSIFSTLLLWSLLFSSIIDNWIQDVRQGLLIISTF